METIGQTLDIAWILVCAALVMLMQAGFSCLESGLVRTKNSINVAVKNFADFCLSSVVFWLFGFGLLFGVTAGGLFGTSGFFFSDTVNPWLMAFFIFQLGFCGTATTIVSGAVAERMRFGGYLVVATIISGVIYPIIGHWIWGSTAGFTPGGWLEQLGFIDFAGSTVVHSVGGWISLAAIIIIGPRIGRFGENAVPIHGHDLPVVTLGVFLLWFGWFGFNGGSALGLTPEVPTIIVNTTVSGAFGGLVAMALAWWLGGRPDVAMIMNGSLAGLVAITASANIMTPLAAAGIGSIAAVFMYVVATLLDRLEVDDVVGAVPVHLAAGIWGTLAVAIFGDPEKWASGLGRLDQFLVQVIGVGATFAWAFGLGFALLWLVNRWFPLRIDPDGERVGLNVAEHGASTEILDLLTEMDTQRRANDYSQPVSVEPHTEIGQIAQQYNRVLADINAEQRRREAMTQVLRQQTASLQLLQGAASAANRAKDIEDAIRTCLESICSFGGWSVGHCYMVDESTNRLVSGKIWHLDNAERLSVFRQVTEKTDYEPGDGLIGGVMASGEPAWVVDITENTPRARIAADVGIKGGAAFPVLVGEDVVAVLEFFSGEPKTPDGTILEVMGAVGTQLGRVVERVRAETARFNSVIDNMPANVYLKDKDQRYILINRNYETFYGVTNNSVRGKRLSEVAGNAVLDQVADKFAAHDREVFEKNTVIEREYKITGAGGYRFLSDRKFPITDPSGEVIALGGVEIEITELKQAQDALRESEEQFRSAFENSATCMVLHDDNGAYLKANQTFCELVGYTERELLQMNWRDITHPDDLESTAVFDEEMVAGSLDNFAMEKRYVHKDGRVVWARLFSTHLRDAEGVPKSIFCVMTDITDRKQAEEELQEAYGIIRDQKERMEDELNIGREIQMSMVPLKFPPFPDHDEFSLFATLKPAREVGGDFYDYYFIDEERLCFCIGDVSGKGVPAALFMAMAKTLIKSRAADDQSTASILTHVNDELTIDNEKCMFVTIFSAILNIRTGELLYTNAGHNPPYLRRKDGTLQRLDQRHGMVVGAIEGMVYAEERDCMEAGDLLLLYTDGITEAMDVEQRLFSESRLRHVLTSMDTDDFDKVVDNTVIAVEAFAGKAEQADDITVLALAFHGSPENAYSAERRIVIQNYLPQIAAVNENFQAFAEEFGVPQPIAMKLKLILDELLSNIMSHAYRDEGDHDIVVRIGLAGERLIVTITDDGVPFNPLTTVRPRTDLALQERQVGGMGIHLVRNLVDDVAYQRRIDKNVLTLVTHFQQKDSAA